MPRIMIKANLEYKVHCCNIFNPKYYLSKAIIPEGMILGKDKPDYPHIKLEFDQYCQVYEETRNNMTPRSVVGIALRPKKDRGSYYFISLETGRIIHARQWTVLHATELVIYRVEQLADN